MYEKKEHDWILESINNPSFTNTDFKTVGLSTKNVSIGSELMYALSSVIRENPIFLTDGKFDNDKFLQYYDLRLLAYNNMAMDTANLDIAASVSFYKDNIFAPFENVRKNPDTLITETFNPDRVSLGFEGFNLEGTPKWSPQELAEMNPIYDPKTGQFTDYTAEESLFKDFGRTAVLATWDFNADVNGNPTNDPVEIYYQKGLYKINPETGTYYYEFTDGPTYDKEVLSKWNILTKEQSHWNDYDFFDSDDRKKSVFGSLMRNAVMLLPLALGPEVTTAYLGGSLLLNFTSTLATLGKMAIGDSNNETLSKVENFVKTTKFTSSDYAKQHTWSAENILNLAGTTFEFLYSMKWMGEQLPKLFGKKAIPSTNEEIKAWKEAREIELRQLFNQQKDKIPTMLGLIEEQKVEKSVGIALTESSIPGLVELEFMQLQKNYQLFGESLSQMYMAISFGTETYGEAKAQGASDEAATALTLGSIAGQYAILKSHIGNWIFPNRLNELRQLKVANLLAKGGDLAIETSKSAIENLNVFLKWFNKGKNLALEMYTPAQTATLATVQGMLAGGVEMTSFEVLRDITASIYNLANKITGQDGHMVAFSDGDTTLLFDRYSSTFFGGALGGVMFAPLRNYKAAKQIHDMKYTEAWLNFIYLAREGKANEVIDKIMKLENISSKDLSELESKTLNDGTKIYSQGSKSDNLDILSKKIIVDLLQQIEKILIKNNLKISDNELLDNLVREYKYLNLLNSKVQSSFVQGFNTAVSELVAIDKAIEDFYKPKTKMDENRPDMKERKSDLDEKELSKLQEKFNTAKEKVQKYLDGTYGKAFVLSSIFEKSTLISSPYFSTSFNLYALNKEKVLSLKDISESRLEELEEEYKNEKSADKILYAHDGFTRFNDEINTNIKPDLEKLTPNLLKVLVEIRRHYLELMKDVEVGDLTGIYTDDVVLHALFIPIAEAENGDGPMTEFLKNKLHGQYSYEDNVKFLFSNKNFNKVWQVVLENEYLPIIIKRPLLKFLTDVSNHYDVKVIGSEKLQDLLLDENGDEVFVDGELSNIKKLKKLVTEKASTSVQDTIFKIASDVFGIDADIVFNTAENIINGAQSIEEISSNGSYLTELDNIVESAKLYASSLIASVKNDTSPHNAFAYNATKNDLYGTKLITLDYIEANNLLKEVYTLLNQAELYRRVFVAVENRKRAIHEKVGLQFCVSFYKKLSTLMDKIPSDWNKQKLEAALNNVDVLKLLADDNVILDEKDTIKFENEILDVQEAIFDFFLDNIEKVNDPIKLMEFINANNFAKDCAKEILDGSKKANIDDRTFIGLLATFASVSAKSSKYLVKNVLLSMKDTDKAIMPLRTQEISALIGLSYLLNRQVFKNFAKAYNKSLGPNAQEKHMFIHPIVLIDAIAGAGKSQAILPLVTRMIQLADSNVTLKVCAIHIGKKEATDLLAQLGLPGTGYSIEEFMKEHFVDYDIVRDANTGKIKPNEDNYYWDEDGIARYKLEVKEIAEPPTLLIIDEAARLSSEDVDALERLEEKYGTKIILAGDVYLAGAVSDKLYPESLGFAEGGNKYIISLNSITSFFSTPRNAISFRNSNNLKDYNTNELALHCDDFMNPSRIAMQLASNSHAIITLKHHITDLGEIIGDKVEELHDGSGLDRQKQEIHLAIVYAKNSGKSIGLIYQSEDSVIYQYIKNGLEKELSDYVLLNAKKGTSAQGGELDYYIVDMTKGVYANSSDYGRTVYTALTRSKQGSLTYLDDETGTFLRSVDDPNITISKPVDKGIINDMIDNYIKLLDKLNLSDKLRIFGVTQPKKIEVQVEAGLDGDLGNVEETRLQLNEKNMSLPRTIPVLPEVKLDPAKPLSDNAHTLSLEVADINIYTVMTNGIGGRVVTDPNTGKDVIELDNTMIDHGLTPAYTKRRDGVNGLIHIAKEFGILSLNPTQQDLAKFTDAEYIWSVIDKIKNAAETANNRQELISKLKVIFNKFGLDMGVRGGLSIDDMYVTFSLVSRERTDGLPATIGWIDKGRTGLARFLKRAIDTAYKIFKGHLNDRDKDLLSDIRLIIGSKSKKDLIEIPILKLMNPETYYETITRQHSEGKRQLPNNWNIVDKAHKLAQNRDLFDKINDYLEQNIFDPYNHGLAVASELLTYAKLFLIFSIANNVAVPITLNNGEWVPRDSFTFDGPKLSLIKGERTTRTWDIYGRLESIPEWEKISDFVKNARVKLSNIMVTKNNITLGDGFVVEAGHPFVIVGDTDLKSDNDMIDALYDTGKHRRAAVMYVLKPIAELEDFFKWLLGTRDQNAIKISKVGSAFTSFRIVQALLSEIESEIQKSKSITGSSLLTSLYAKLKPIIELINAIEAEANTLTGTDKNERLKKVAEILKSNSQIKGHEHIGNDPNKPILILAVFDSFLFDFTFGNADRGLTKSSIFGGDQEKILIQKLKEKGFENTYWETKLDSSSTQLNIRGFIYLANIDRLNDPYSLILSDGTKLPFRMLGKYDSTIAHGNMTPLLNNILSQIRRVNKPNSISKMWEEINQLHSFTDQYTKYMSDISNTVNIPIFANPRLQNRYGTADVETKLNNDLNVIWFKNKLGLYLVFESKERHGMLEKIETIPDTEQPGETNDYITYMHPDGSIYLLMKTNVEVTDGLILQKDRLYCIWEPIKVSERSTVQSEGAGEILKINLRNDDVLNIIDGLREFIIENGIQIKDKLSTDLDDIENHSIFEAAGIDEIVDSIKSFEEMINSNDQRVKDFKELLDKYILQEEKFEEVEEKFCTFNLKLEL